METQETQLPIALHFTLHPGVLCGDPDAAHRVWAQGPCVAAELACQVRRRWVVWRKMLEIITAVSVSPQGALQVLFHATRNSTGNGLKTGVHWGKPALAHLPIHPASQACPPAHEYSALAHLRLQVEWMSCAVLNLF